MPATAITTSPQKSTKEASPARKASATKAGKGVARCLEGGGALSPGGGAGKPPWASCGGAEPPGAGGCTGCAVAREGMLTLALR